MPDLAAVIWQLVGRKIVRVDAEEWDEEHKWLTSPGSVVIHLDGGIQLRSLGGSIEVDFEGEGAPTKRVWPEKLSQTPLL